MQSGCIMLVDRQGGCQMEWNTVQKNLFFIFFSPRNLDPCFAVSKCMSCFVPLSINQIKTNVNVTIIVT
jgi:hypothetical protein